MYVILLAGGGGVRLWPLSKAEFPKQFLHFGDKESLLQKAVRRFSKLEGLNNIVISTSCQYRGLVERQIGENHADVSILEEPERRNTAPAIALAVQYLEEACFASPDAIVLVAPSDHVIEPESELIASIDNALLKVADASLVLFGITPRFPETGYGYIEARPSDGLYDVVRFVEKPPRSVAEQYLAAGNYYWNSGMFAFTIRSFWQLLQKTAPDLYHLSLRGFAQNKGLFADMPDISFDYAVVERAKNVKMAPLSLFWSDVGSWDSVYEYLHKDQHHNVKLGNIHAIDTERSLIMGGSRPISTVGLQDVLIVQTEEATFIGKRGRSQQIRDIIAAFPRDRVIYETDAVRIECHVIHVGKNVSVSSGATVLVGYGKVQVVEDKEIEVLFPCDSWKMSRLGILCNVGDETAEVLILRHKGDL